jgi:transcription initiation factor IIE alpha subunit
VLAPWRTIPTEPVVDNRPRCPKCGERLEDDKASWCYEELLDHVMP